MVLESCWTLLDEPGSEKRSNSTVIQQNRTSSNKNEKYIKPKTAHTFSKHNTVGLLDVLDELDAKSLT